MKMQLKDIIISVLNEDKKSEFLEELKKDNGKLYSNPSDWKEFLYADVFKRQNEYREKYTEKQMVVFKNKEGNLKGFYLYDHEEEGFMAEGVNITPESIVDLFDVEERKVIRYFEITENNT